MSDLLARCRRTRRVVAQEPPTDQPAHAAEQAEETSDELGGGLRSFGNDPTILPYVYRRPMHSSRTLGSLACPNQCALDPRSQPRVSVQALALAGGFDFHGPDSISFAGLLELSYAAQAFASER
jgi:hypothetical protein